MRRDFFNGRAQTDEDFFKASTQSLGTLSNFSNTTSAGLTVFQKLSKLWQTDQLLSSPRNLHCNLRSSCQLHCSKPLHATDDRAGIPDRPFALLFHPVTRSPYSRRLKRVPTITEINSYEEFPNHFMIVADY
jgi:hypothetical protein